MDSLRNEQYKFLIPPPQLLLPTDHHFKTKQDNNKKHNKQTNKSQNQFKMSDISESF